MDQIRKVLTHDNETIISVISAKELLTESLNRLKLWPPSLIHLGNAWMGVLLLTVNSKKESIDKMTLQWNVSGPFGNLYTEANQFGQSRGTISVPQATVQNFNTKLGVGLLQVQKVEGGHSTTGIVEAHGDICQDILEYLGKSEQRRCALNFWIDLKFNNQNKEQPILINNALGFLLEMIPTNNRSRDEAKAFFWEQRLLELGGLSKWKLSSDPVKSIFDILNDSNPYKEILFQKISFHCPCNEERARRALTLAINLDPTETKSDTEEVRCEYCGKVYIL